MTLCRLCRVAVVVVPIKWCGGRRSAPSPHRRASCTQRTPHAPAPQQQHELGTTTGTRRAPAGWRIFAEDISWAAVQGWGPGGDLGFGRFGISSGLCRFSVTWHAPHSASKPHRTVLINSRRRAMHGGRAAYLARPRLHKEVLRFIINSILHSSYFIKNLIMNDGTSRDHDSIWKFCASLSTRYFIHHTSLRNLRMNDCTSRDFGSSLLAATRSAFEAANSFSSISAFPRLNSALTEFASFERAIVHLTRRDQARNFIRPRGKQAWCPRGTQARSRGGGAPVARGGPLAEIERGRSLVEAARDVRRLRLRKRRRCRWRSHS